MATARPTTRPLSPHLTIWRWRPAMAASIMHRATGAALGFGVVLLLLWGLVALASGPEAYGVYYRAATGWLGRVVAIGATYVVFQHMMTGLRHLYMDTGAGLEISVAHRHAALTFVVAIVLTALVWALILL